MRRGMTFRPELEMSVTVRKIPFEYGKMISETLGAALEEIKEGTELVWDYES